MKFPLVPAYYFSDIYAIDLARLRARGVKLLLADLDNTLVPYGVAEPNHQVRAWKAALEAAGITLFILSNSRRPGRAQRFAQALGVPYEGHAGKPKRGGFQRAMARMGVTPEETAIVGDQIFTDTWGGTTPGCSPCWCTPSGLGRCSASSASHWRPPSGRGPKGGDPVRARFGTAGNPDGFYQAGKKQSKDMPPWLREQGLEAYEYQCGKGVTVGEATARAIGRAAAGAGIALSLHAPYFVNPANPDPDSQEKTLGHVLKACQVAQWMGADRVVVHTGALQKRTREEALATAKAFFQTLRRRCDEAGYGDILLCPETMGKINQLGDLEEVLAICAPSEGLLPCVDFGHLYARSLGALDGAAAVERMLDRMVQVLGEARARVFHSHFSKIEYTPRGGEARHLTFDQPYFGPDYHPLCQALARRGWAPRVICESAGTQDVDALAMQRAYRQALGEGP